MNRTCTIILLLVACITSAIAQDHSCVGFAAQNGGTTGGQGATPVRVYNYEQLKAAVEKNEKDLTPRYVEVVGKIEVAGGGEPITVGSNTTIRGVGSTAFISQIEMYVKNASNVIIQNIKFSAIGSGKGSSADLISIATTGSAYCRNIWVDHCEFFNVTPIREPSASLKDKYDGMIDVKGQSEYITISWCYFHDHYKSCLFGFSEGKDQFDRKVTMHHNLFERLNSRLPSLRYGTAHIYNNCYVGTQDELGWFGSAINLRDNCTALVEANSFYGMSNTIYSADSPLPGSWCGAGNITDENSDPVDQTLFADGCFTPPYTVRVDDAATLRTLLVPGKSVGVGVVDTEEPTNNNKPTISITAPVADAVYDATLEPASITVTADASDSDGQVVSVEFFSNGRSIGVDTEAPYSCTFTTATGGLLTLTAKVTDDKAATATSEPVVVSVTGQVVPPASGELLLDDDFTTGSGTATSSTKGTWATDKGVFCTSATYSSGSDQGYTGFFKVKAAVTFPEVSSCGKIVMAMRASSARNAHIQKRVDGVWQTIHTFEVSSKGDYTCTTEVASTWPVQYQVIADNDTYFYSVKIYAAASSAIDTVDGDKRVVQMQYYNLSGSVVDRPSKGIYICKTVWEDGSYTTQKVMMID